MSGGNLLQRRGNVNFFTDDIFQHVQLAGGPVDDQAERRIFENVPSETFHPLLS